MKAEQIPLSDSTEAVAVIRQSPDSGNVSGVAPEVTDARSSNRIFSNISYKTQSGAGRELRRIII